MNYPKPLYCPPPGAILPPPVKISAPASFFADQLPLLQNASWFHSSTITIQASIGDVQVIKYQNYAKNSSVTATQNLFDTKFRLASVTKVFTVLAILLSGDKIGWEDSITKYIPGLDAAGYKDVSIGALSGQTSGLGRYGYVSDLSFVPTFKPALLGIAPTNVTLPGCDPFPGGPVCNSSQVLDMFNNPLYQPASSNVQPLYSNIAYNLLGQALEAVYPNYSYTDIISNLIFKPTGMTAAGFSTPKKTSEAILPTKGEQWFAAPFANYDPSGGIWATPADFHRFAQALRFTKPTLLSKSAMRKWFQPHSFLPSLHQLVGAPWEIIRPTDLNVTVSRPIDIFAKSGGVSGYTSYLVLIPEYDITITMNIAGNSANSALQDLLPAVVKPVVALADAEARKQALKMYTGTYRGEGNSTLKLTMDDGPGLKISEFVMNGAPVIAGLAALQSIPLAQASARIYPTDPDAWTECKQAWRLQMNVPRGRGNDWAEMNCASWNFGDPARYMGAAVDELGITVDKQGRATSIELVGWRTSLKKI